MAGASYDPCFHEACDALRNQVLTPADTAVYAELRAEYPMVGNVNMLAFEKNIDAIAHSVITFAYSAETVNGVVGSKGKTKIRSGSGGGVQSGSGDMTGGGLHDEHHELLAS